MITFVLTSGRPSPTLIEAGIKNFWLSMVFSYGIWIGISLSYCFTGQTDISKAFTMDYIIKSNITKVNPRVLGLQPLLRESY